MRFVKALFFSWLCAVAFNYTSAFAVASIAAAMGIDPRGSLSFREIELARYGGVFVIWAIALIILVKRYRKPSNTDPMTVGG